MPERHHNNNYIMLKLKKKIPFFYSPWLSFGLQIDTKRINHIDHIVGTYIHFSHPFDGCIIIDVYPRDEGLAVASG